MSVYTSGDCRVIWNPPVLLGTWEVTITRGTDPENDDDDPA